MDLDSVETDNELEAARKASKVHGSVADPDPGSGMGVFRIPDPKTIF